MTNSQSPLSQKEIDRLARQSQERSEARRNNPHRHPSTSDIFVAIITAICIVALLAVFTWWLYHG